MVAYTLPGFSNELMEKFNNYPSIFCETFFTMNGKPLVLYPYQVRCINDDTKRQIWFRARQTGKSTDISLKALQTGICNSDLNIPIISARQRFSNRIIRNCKRLIKRSTYYDSVLSKLTVDSNKDLAWSKTEIEFSNGSLIVALPEGEEGTAAVGESSHLVFVDEVARMKDAEFLINSVIRPSLFATDGNLILASSSWGKYGKGAAWYDLVKGGAYKVHEINAYNAIDEQREVITEREYNNKLEFLKEEERINPVMFQMQYMNSFEGGMDNPFTEETIDKCFTSSSYIKRDNAYIVFSIDWGKSSVTGDKTVVAIFDISNYNDIHLIKFYSYSLDYLTAIAKINELAMAWKPKLILCDIGAGEAQLEILSKSLGGVSAIEGVKAGKVLTESVWRDHGITRRIFDKNTAVANLSAYMDLGTITIHSSDYAIKKEFYDYTMEITTANNIRYTHLPGGHDDHIDVVLQLISKLRFKGTKEQKAKHYDFIENRYNPYEALKEKFGFNQDNNKSLLR